MQSSARDQYQHYIPRFILRRFQVVPDTHKTKKQRQREYRQAKKNPSLVKDDVLAYDVASGVLQSRPLGVVYGEMNLYKDFTNTENFNHVEQKLSQLESDAAVFVNRLHNAIMNTGGCITVTRKELGIFRKFLFVMHYRSTHHQFSYFNEDRPENASMKEWIKQRKKDRGLATDRAVWVDALQYHLDHPHHKIIEEGETIMEEYGDANSIVTQEIINPHINLLAVEYTSIANNYYMGIWEAADGSEFVIGSNSFGLWEGKGLIHRLYPLSPRLVIIFRQTVLRQFEEAIGGTSKRGDIPSDLFGIPIEAAVPRYPNYKGEFDERFIQYKRSDIAQKDTYTFKITQLSKSQTQSVNNVFLLNALQDGTVSFSSRSCMLVTLKAFTSTDFIHYLKTIGIYSPLLMELNSTSSGKGH